ncbi:RHS repeat domain-containing protein [Snodgrassella alvi]|uniref:RHS protein conserved region domain-containing protein n=1 Tax=Snodgrassella alvi TaxID=1196083 RepID=A0A2N9Y039_9NEIS|nr:RHS repeat-associated core domain-containing protein [Snodgrassella alvi]PIT58050.1 hypothetical protein BHC49_02795 [Snodgrassella alvi]
MIQETGPNHPTSLYIYTDQNSYEPLARIDTDGNHEQYIRYFHTDLNGCPEELTDANGKILWECSFQLWGKRIHEIEHEPIEQNLRYQGQYLDRETGLHYNTFRYYDPDIGRFTQPDPIGLAGGFNLYQYAPNGLTWVDPWGLNCDNAKWTKKGWKHVFERHFKKQGSRWNHKSKFNIGNEQDLKKIIDKTIKKGKSELQRNGKTAFEYDFGKPIGSRTNLQTGIVEYQNKVLVIVNKHGEIVTAFPSN